MPRGYLKPIYSEYLPLEGHWRHGYPKKEFSKIVAGYGCGNCGEDYMGVYHERCPVCLHLSLGGGDPPPHWGRAPK